MITRFFDWLSAWILNDLPYQRERKRRKVEKYLKEQEKKKNAK